MAANGYESQQTNAPIDPRRPNNLFAPVDGAYAAHGSFDASAHRNSIQLSSDKHRGWLLAIAMASGAASLFAGFAHRVFQAYGE